MYTRYMGGSGTTTTDLTLALNHPTSSRSNGGGTTPALAGSFSWRSRARSTNGTSWTTVVVQSQTSSTAQTQRFTGTFGSNVSYVRVTFVGLPGGQPAGLAELVVGGM